MVTSAASMMGDASSRSSSRSSVSSPRRRARLRVPRRGTRHRELLLEAIGEANQPAVQLSFDAPCRRLEEMATLAPSMRSPARLADRVSVAGYWHECPITSTCRHQSRTLESAFLDIDSPSRRSSRPMRSGNWLIEHHLDRCMEPGISCEPGKTLPGSGPRRLDNQVESERPIAHRPDRARTGVQDSA